MIPAHLSKPNAVPKPSQTRLDVKEDARKADERLLANWRRDVRERDGQACRCCGRRVVQTLALRANRAECHHIVSRSHKPTRHDRRNGLLTCFECHQRIEQHELQIVGTQTFRLGTQEYLNADGPITVKELT